MSYRRGEVVYEKGAPAQFVYLVTEGALFRFKRLPGDRRSIIQFLFPGDAFGYEIGRRHRDTVEALTHVKIRSVGKEALLDTAAIDARLSKALSSAAFWAARAAEDQSIGLRGRNATEQLALFFLEMDARLSKGGRDQFTDAKTTYRRLLRTDRRDSLQDNQSLSPGKNDRVLG